MKYFIFGMGNKFSLVLFEDNGLDFRQLREMWGLKQTTIHSAGRVRITSEGVKVDNNVPELGFSPSPIREKTDIDFILKNLFTEELREKLK